MAHNVVQQAIAALKQARLRLLQERMAVFEDSSRPKARLGALQQEYAEAMASRDEAIANRGKLK